MHSKEIREKFLKYFGSKGHKIVQSHSLIPPDDPTLLFVNAGMVQFKDIFLGKKEFPYKRACSSQKCLRVSGKHNDLEQVGWTNRHHTFFEMLGNFSFGDYFKKEAIVFAWQLLTEEYGLKGDKFHVTVHPQDRESYRIWKEIIKIPEKRIFKDETNFWAMGDTGPCGHCSEIHIDRGEKFHGGSIFNPGERFVELWNLVFMEYERKENGEIIPLPAPSIDTGMGLERISAVLQGVESNYESDLFKGIISLFETISEKKYHESDENRVAFRVIADHSRAISFLVAEGIYPEREGRGYVLRRLIRRAIRFGKKLGVEEPFLYKLCLHLIDEIGEIYPELISVKRIMGEVVSLEEERFLKTLSSGLQLLENEILKCEKEALKKISGEVVFSLYDTHGFPVDLTEIIARERGISVDMEEFEKLMNLQKKRGRESWIGTTSLNVSEIEEYVQKNKWAFKFTGYEEEETSSKIVFLFKDGKRVKTAFENENILIITNESSFYGEAGGQVGDTGEIITENSSKIIVSNTTRLQGGISLHHCEVEKGIVREGENVKLIVDIERRTKIRRNHSATHLLHWALRHVIGSHVRQHGSLVEHSRLRFDFSHFKSLSEEEIFLIEEIVNKKIIENKEVKTSILPLERAIEKGAIAFFADKYEEIVRMVEIGEESKELCGGTHVQRSGEIGFFKILSEQGISAGVRRIEAVTGERAVLYVQEISKILKEISSLLKVSEKEIPLRIEKLIKENKKLQEEIKKRDIRTLKEVGSEDIKTFGDIKALTLITENMDGLREISDSYRAKIKEGVILIINKSIEKIALLIATTKNLKEKLKANEILKELILPFGGRGGGKETLAEGGCENVEDVEKIKEQFYRIVSNKLEDLKAREEI